MRGTFPPGCSTAFDRSLLEFLTVASERTRMSNRGLQEILRSGAFDRPESPDVWSDWERKNLQLAWWTFELLNDERRIGVPVEKRVQYTELVDTDRLYEALRRQGYKGREEFRRRFAQSHETCCTRPGYCFMMSVRRPAQAELRRLLRGDQVQDDPARQHRLHH